jgi:hypothetical protein
VGDRHLKIYEPRDNLLDRSVSADGFHCLG